LLGRLLLHEVVDFLLQRRHFFCDVFILPHAHNRLVVAVLQYLGVQKRRYVEFWQERVSHEPTKIHPQRFLIKSETIARKTRRKRVK
jgi:hypothetical protein